MDQRKLFKYVAKLVIMTAAGSTVTKVLLSAIPATQNYKIAELTGAVGGWYVGEKLEPQTDELVDNYFDKRENLIRL